MKLKSNKKLFVFMFFILLATVVLFDGDTSFAFTNDHISGEVLAAAESYEDALQTAVHMNLKLKSYAYGIAVFYASDPEKSVRQSLYDTSSESSLLCLNRLYEVYETTRNSNQTFIQYHHNDMDNDLAWEISTGKNVVVAVIDTGVDTYHDEFSNKLFENSYNSHTDQVGLKYVNDENGHGTHIAGIIAAGSANNSGVYGVAPDVDLLIIKAARPADNKFELSSLLRAINYAVDNGADIINMSLGSPFSSGEVKLERDVISDAVNKGVIIICAAGNDRLSHASYPAAYPETIAVSALKQGCIFDDSYSNYGPEIDISAPGTAIYSTAIGGLYKSMSGTSMATPNVATVAALIKSIHPEYGPDKIKSVLCETAREAGKLGWDEYYGFGVLNSYAALLGVDALSKITYDFNDGNRDPVSVKAAVGSKLIEPDWPERKNYLFRGWYIKVNEYNLYDFASLVGGDISLLAYWDKSPVSVYSISGLIKSNNSQNITTLKLSQGNIVKYITTIPAVSALGLQEQSFAFIDIEPGDYSLEIEKASHTKYVIKSIIVEDDDIDLTHDSRSEVRKITLLSGDINSDGEINQTDLNILWQPRNYNQFVENSENKECDINGDGEINQIDLNILWLSANYNKGAVYID